MSPFPTKYKHKTVDDYLQYQVTQPYCHLGRDKGIWPKNHSSFFPPSSVFVASIHSSGESLKLEINFSFGKVTPLKTSKPPLQYVNITTAGLQRLTNYIFEKINLDTQLTVVKARPFSAKRNFSGVNSSSLEFIYTLRPN